MANKGEATKVEDVKSEAKEVTKDAKKDNAKVDDSKEDTKNGKRDEDEESSDDEEYPGLYDKPVVIEGKRERKTPVFLASQTAPQTMTIPKSLTFEGKGEALGTMERTNYELGRSTAIELKPLHKLLFGRDGRAPEIKKNIRKFNGFAFEKDSKEYEAKKFNVERFTNDGLKRLCEIFDLEKKGKRNDLQEKVMDFLMSPKSSGRPAPQPKAKKSEQKKRKRSSNKDASKSKKSAKTSETIESGEEGDEDDDDDDEEDSEEEQQQEEEIKTPPKKKKKTEATPKKTEMTPKKKESSPKKGKEAKTVKEKSKEKGKSKEKSKAKKTDEKSKTPKKKEPVTVKITPLKKPSSKKTPKKDKPAPAEEDSSDEEPLAKKTRKEPPTNSDLENIVKDLLDGADLEKVTMKSVCKQVYDMFPDHDLTSRKDFIKETVRKVIA